MLKNCLYNFSNMKVVNRMLMYSILVICTIIIVSIIAPKTESWNIDLQIVKKTPVLSSPEKLHNFEESQELRHSKMETFCRQRKYINPKYNKVLPYDDAFFYNDKKKFTYCRIPKVACTTWKKALAYTLGFVASPYNVTLNKLYSLKMPYLEDIAKSPAELQKRLEYFSFMFSRHPFDRLLSGYRNKFLDPWRNRSQYLEHYGPIVVKALGGDVASHPKQNYNGKMLMIITFEEFCRFVLQQGYGGDAHWRPQTRLCHICDHQFTFLGKFERLNQEANMIFKKLDIDMSLPNEIDYTKKTTEMLQKYYKQLPRDLLADVYEYYRDDFQAFGYDPEEYFKM